MSTTTTTYARRLPGRKTNQMAAIKQSIAQLRVETNPMIKPRACRGNPPPIASALSKWHARTVSIIKSSSSNAEVTFTMGDIIKSLNNSATGTTIRVKSVKVWNTSISSNVDATLVPTVIVNSATAPSGSLQFTDYGTGNNLAGVHFNIPDTLAIVTQPTNATTDVFLKVNSFNLSGGSQLLVHVSLDFLM